MEIDELLKQANLKYPVGTVYWNLNCAGERSNGNRPHRRTGKREARVEFTNFGGYGPVIAIGDYDGYVYSGGKWAEIVFNHYEIY